MQDEQIQARRDVRPELRDDTNKKAALGTRIPGLDKSFEQEIKEIVQKVADNKMLVSVATQAITNVVAKRGSSLTPFIELRGPKW